MVNNTQKALTLLTWLISYLKKYVAQGGARTHDPEIKSLMIYRLS